MMNSERARALAEWNGREAIEHMDNPGIDCWLVYLSARYAAHHAAEADSVAECKNQECGTCHKCQEQHKTSEHPLEGE